MEPRSSCVDFSGGVGREHLEDGHADCGLVRVVEIDLIHVADEPVSNLRLRRDGNDDLLDETHRLAVVELDGPDFLPFATQVDGGSAGCPQVSSPVRLAERADEAPAAAVLA